MLVVQLQQSIIKIEKIHKRKLYYKSLKYLFCFKSIDTYVIRDPLHFLIRLRRY